MSKKWLYSVAVGALLIAGEALGITVHDALSNGFWSAELRGSERQLKQEVDNNFKMLTKVSKYKQKKDGTEETRHVWVTTSFPLYATRWKKINRERSVTKPENRDIHYTNIKLKLTATRQGKTYKEKTIIDTQRKSFSPPFSIEYHDVNTSVYTAKPLKKDIRPMGPLVVDDWFPDSIEKTWGVDGRFYGTEENAVTNIISDNEAYITRTIAQTGYIENYEGYPVNEDASLLRTYNTHITTDDDHVYVDQTICENSTNNPLYNQQDAYQTQYVATFKKGQWKNSTETITQVSNQQSANWWINYLKQKQEQTTRISSQQPDHWTMNQRPRQNSR